MNYNDIVPMITEPMQVPDSVYMKNKYTPDSFYTPIPKYIYDLLGKEILSVRKRKNPTAFAFDREVVPDYMAERLRNLSDGFLVRPEGGLFSVSELNDLLRRDYDSSLYNLGQAKARATATQNILDMILGQ